MKANKRMKAKAEDLHIALSNVSIKLELRFLYAY